MIEPTDTLDHVPRKRRGRPRGSGHDASEIYTEVKRLQAQGLSLRKAAEIVAKRRRLTERHVRRLISAHNHRGLVIRAQWEKDWSWPKRVDMPASMRVSNSYTSFNRDLLAKLMARASRDVGTLGFLRKRT